MKTDYFLQVGQILLSVIMLLLLLLRNGAVSLFLFWISFWLLVIVSLMILLNSSIKYKLFSLFVLEVSLTLISIFSLPLSYQMDRDTFFEAQYASTIIAEGKWDPSSGIGFGKNYYGYNPVLHFIIALISLVSGLSTYFVSKYLMLLILRIFFAISVFMILKTFIKKESILYFSFFVFISSYSMTYLSVSRRLVADIFFMLAFYCMFNRKFDFLFYVFSALIILSNHSVAYLMLIFLISLLVLRTVFLKLGLKAEFPNNIAIKLFYFTAILIFWEVFFSSLILKNDLSYLANISSMITSGYAFNQLLKIGTSAPSLFQYYPYELFVLYLSMLLFILFSIIGFIVLIFQDNLRRELNQVNLFMVIGIAAGICYGASFIMMRTELDSAAYTFLWFFSIFMSMFVGVLLEYLRQKINAASYLAFILAIAVIFYSGYLLSGMYTPRLINRQLDEGVVLGVDVRSITPEVYYSGMWMKNHASRNSRILADLTSFQIYSGMFELEVSDDVNMLKALFTEPDVASVLGQDAYFGSYTHTFYLARIDYIVLNDKLLTEPNYLFSKPVGNNGQLDSVSGLDRIYDNGEIAVYKNNG